MKSRLFFVVCAPIIVLGCSFLGQSQTLHNTDTTSQPSSAAEYPKDRAGVFIQNTDWLTLDAATPEKTKTKGGIAASLSYGAVPATVVAEYAGTSANVRLAAARPVICLCHLISLPGTPVIVKLHRKKDSRELDGGKMVVYPVVGGSKTADANRSDLVPVETTQPENQVWLVRPKEPLAPGEYALMLGTQNVAIFPFTVVAENEASIKPSSAK